MKLKENRKKEEFPNKLMDYIIPILVGVVCLGAGIAIGYLIRKNEAEKKIGRAEDMVTQLIDDAQKKAESIRKENIINAKEEIQKLRQEFDNEIKDRRNEQSKNERRLTQREEALDRKLDSLEQKDAQLNKRIKEVGKQKEEVDALIKKQLEQVEKYKKLEARLIPDSIDYDKIDGLRIEARQKLSKIRPRSVGQASRISGVSPADMNVLLIYLQINKEN